MSVTYKGRVYHGGNIRIIGVYLAWIADFPAKLELLAVFVGILQIAMLTRFAG